MSEINFNFANGFAVSIFNEQGFNYITITNANGYVITDKKLTKEQEKELISMLSE